MIDGNGQRQAPSPESLVSVGADWQTRNQRMRARIRSSTDLPTLPIIVLRVIDKASCPDCDPEELVRLIGQDPALCGKILRTVNSAAIGLRQPVSSLLGAIRVLGLDPLRSLVLASSLSGMRQPPMSRTLLQSYWRVSVAGGLVARRMAQRAGTPAPETDLVAGLLRDLGMLVLHQLCPKEYQAVLDASPVILSAFQCELEDEALQITHAEAGAELLRIWRMPDEVIEPVRYHHDWARADQQPEPHRRRARLLYFATQLGQLQLSAERPMLVHQVRTLADEHFGMREEELRGLLRWVQEQMEEFAAILEVDLGHVIDYSDVLTRGVEELTRLTVSANRPLEVALHQQTAPGARVEVAQPALAGARKSGAIEHTGSWSKETSNHPESGFANEALAVREIQNRLFEKPQRPGTLGMLGGYEVTDVIGYGGMGSVFRAVDKQLNRPVAIKTLLPHLADKSGALARFLQEGRAVAALTHENIVRVYAVGASNGIPYLVMEFIQGRTLTDRLLAEAPLPLPEVIRIGLQTASGLAVAHANGLVHRDIKPANLLLENGTGRVKIVDFGLAQLAAEAALVHGHCVEGTPHFMSPEQTMGRPTDPRSDMFSLGCVLYTACTGHLPFDGETTPEVFRAICTGQPTPIRSLNPAMPAWLEEVLAGLLANDPARRFPTAAEMKRLFLSRWAGLYTARKG